MMAENKETIKRKLIIPDETKSLTREIVEMILLVLILIVGIRNLIGEPRWIPSESMKPALIINDRLFIEKLSLFFYKPQRGDIIVFYPPQEKLLHDPWSEVTRAIGIPSKFKDIAYIKRLVGMPGDKFEVRPGVGVFVNDKLLDEPYVTDVPRTGCNQPGAYCGPFIIPKGEYFAMGDNRNNSQDSRYWGFLPKDRIIGMAFVKFWPLDRIELIQRPHYNVK